MEKQERQEILEGAKQAFFKAMRVGYASNSKRVKKERTPDGYKTITFTDGDYTVIDRYCVTPRSDYSAGTTTILFKGAPVWWMSYCGFYDKDVIPFLKRALAKTYRRNEFNGGRGPESYKDRTHKFEYSNSDGYDWERCDFSNFKGKEEIWEKTSLSTGVQRGFHKYFGHSLI